MAIKLEEYGGVSKSKGKKGALGGASAVLGTPTKYEAFLGRPDVIEILLRLATGTKKMPKNGKKLMKVPPDELLYAEGTLGGAQHGLNRVFASSVLAGKGMRLPFYARARGNELQIGRISELFDEDNYAIGKNGGKKYERPYIGQPERVKVWLEKLAVVGIRFEPADGEKWIPLSPEAAHKLVENIPVEMKAETLKLLEEYTKEYLEKKAEIERAAEVEKTEAEVEKAVEMNIELVEPEMVDTAEEMPKHSMTTAIRDGSKAEVESTG